MSFRFRIGAFTFGKTGIRYSVWRRRAGISVPLDRKTKKGGFGKLALGPLRWFFRF